MGPKGGLQTKGVLFARASLPPQVPKRRQSDFVPHEAGLLHLGVPGKLTPDLKIPQVTPEIKPKKWGASAKTAHITTSSGGPHGRGVGLSRS